MVVEFFWKQVRGLNPLEVTRVQPTFVMVRRTPVHPRTPVGRAVCPSHSVPAVYLLHYDLRLVLHNRRHGPVLGRGAHVSALQPRATQARRYDHVVRRKNPVRLNKSPEKFISVRLFWYKFNSPKSISLTLSQALHHPVLLCASYLQDPTTFFLILRFCNFSHQIVLCCMKTVRVLTLSGSLLD